MDTEKCEYCQRKNIMIPKGIRKNTHDECIRVFVCGFCGMEMVVGGGQ